MEHLGEVGARRADPFGHALDQDRLAAWVVKAAQGENCIAGGLGKWVQSEIPAKKEARVAA
jgi:hypothetical protein